MHPPRFSLSVLAAVGAGLLALAVAGSADAGRSDSTDCTETNVYWTQSSIYGKKYDSAWANVGENTPFFQSGRSYWQMLAEKTEQNPYNELALDYISALLNVYAGASMPSDVLVAFLDAEALFATYTPSYDFDTDPDGVVVDFEELRSVLRLYNRGRIGPGAC